MAGRRTCWPGTEDDQHPAEVLEPLIYFIGTVSMRELSQAEILAGVLAGIELDAWPRGSRSGWRAGDTSMVLTVVSWIARSRAAGTSPLSAVVAHHVATMPSTAT
jgi:hypothetical protein